MKPGDKFQNINRTLCHVIAVTDHDGPDGPIVTFKRWVKGRQRWEYDAEPQLLIEDFLTVESR